MARYFIFLLLVVSLYAENSPLSLQDALISVSDDIDKNTSSAVTKEYQEAKHAPASISVFTQKDLDRFDTLFEALSTLGGIIVGEGYFNKLYFGIRSVDVNRDQNVLLILNGLKLSDSDSQSFLLRTLPLRSVRKIEIIKGPSSVLYGSGAYQGVISITTFKGEKYDKNLVETDLADDSQWGFKSRYNLGEKGMVSISAKNLHEEIDSPVTLYEMRGNGMGTNTLNVNSHYSNDSEHAILGFLNFEGVNVTYGWGKLEGDSYSNYTELRNGRSHNLFEESYNTQFFIGANYEHKTSENSLLKINSRYLDSSDKFLLTTAGSSMFSREFLSSYQFEVQHFWKVNEQFKWLLGFEREVGSYSREDSKGSGDSNIGSHGYFLQNTWNINQDLSLLSSFRLNHGTLSGWVSIPRFALTWQQSSKNTFKIIHGKAYKDPNPFFAMDSQRERENLQRIRSIEYIWLREFNGADLSVSYFTNYEKIPLFNRSSKTYGFDILARKQHNLNFSTFVDFSHWTFEEGQGIRLGDGEIITLGTEWKFGKSRKWQMNWDSVFVKADGGMYTNNNFEGYTELNNISLFYNHSKNHRLSLYVENIFNKQYDSLAYVSFQNDVNIPSIPQGRTAKISWRVLF
jgi:outer membrane receptor for ferrienterochelin and colicin